MMEQPEQCGDSCPAKPKQLFRRFALIFKPSWMHTSGAVDARHRRPDVRKAHPGRGSFRKADDQVNLGDAARILIGSSSLVLSKSLLARSFAHDAVLMLRF